MGPPKAFRGKDERVTMLKKKGCPVKNERISIGLCSPDASRSLTQQNGPIQDELIVKSYVALIDSEKTCLTAAGKSLKAEREAGALRWLNKLGCQHVPTLIATRKRTKKAKEGPRREQNLYMTKVPGRTLKECYKDLPETEKQQVRAAFKVAIKAVHACGVDNGSHHYGNVIWDKMECKCYIVDFERARFDGVEKYCGVDRSEDPEHWGML